MSGMDDYFEGAAAGIAAELGSQGVELRRPCTLRDGRQDSPSDLVAAAAAAAGSTALSVRASDGRALHGDVPRGLAATTSAGTVAVTADSRTMPPAAVVTLAVEALPGDVAEGSTVALADYASRTVQDCLVYAVRQDLLQLFGADSFAVSFPSSNLGGDPPRLGDVVVCARGTATVLARPDEGGGSFDAVAGRAAAGRVA